MLSVRRIQSHHRLMGLTNTPSDLLPGTLELLILKSLVSGRKHGYGIVEHLRVTSRDVLSVGESALYPALQRLLLNGWARAEWGLSDTNRRARYYTVTAAGRKQLAEEARSSSAWFVESSTCWKRVVRRP